MWQCDTCIHKSKLNNSREICIRYCKDVFNRLNRENHSYQKQINKPSCCGECPYILKSTTDDKYYLCTVYIYDYDDNRPRNRIIRKNYLTKNTPKWCKLK